MGKDVQNKPNIFLDLDNTIISAEAIEDFPFTKKDRTFCLDWNISQFIIDYDEQFNIDYLIELFSIDSIKAVICCKLV